MQHPILIVEDDDDIRHVLEEVFNLESITYVSCRNGLEAWDKLKTGLVPCIVLTDIMMPVMDGFELIERISTLEHLRQVPIIAATASTTLRQRIASGVEAIPKPYDLNRLIDKINLVTSGGNLCDETQN